MSKSDAEKLEADTKKRKHAEDSDSPRKSRAIGPKSKMKSLKSLKSKDEPLLGIEDIDPDYQKPVQSSVRHPLSSPAAQKLKMSASARTQPISIKPSVKTRLPVKPIKKAVKNPKIPDLVKIVGEGDEGDSGLEISHELILDIRDVSSLQYVRWDIIKSKFQTNDIDLYFWVRPGRGRNILFLTKCGDKPYVATAINLRNIQVKYL